MNKETILERLTENVDVLENVLLTCDIPELAAELAKMKQFKLKFEDVKNYLELTYKETGEVKRTYYKDADEVGYWASKYICFNDIDETYRVTKIVMDSREVSYAGWIPGMHFEYYDNETHEVVAHYEFPDWDH